MCIADLSRIHAVGSFRRLPHLADGSQFFCVDGASISGYSRPELKSVGPCESTGIRLHPKFWSDGLLTESWEVGIQMVFVRVKDMHSHGLVGVSGRIVCVV